MRKIAEAVDRGLHYIIEEYLTEVVWAVLILLSVCIRLLLIPTMQSDDYIYFLEPWVEAYRGHDIRTCLTMSVGNYFVPYNLFLIWVSRLTIEPFIPIAFLSCIADYGCAWMVWRIVKKSIAGNTALWAGVLVVMLPHVFLNSALWKQCDSVYVFFMLASMDAMFKERPTGSFALLGLGLAFKLQSVFLLPFYLYLYAVKKNYSILQWLWLPVMYFAAGLPALLAGKPFAETYNIYKEQIEEPGGIVRNLPNVYYLGLPPEDVAKKAGICFALAVLAAVFYVFMRKGVLRPEKRTAEHILVAAFFIWTCIMFLPGMHDRYDYPVTILITVYALMVRTRGAVMLAVVLQLIDVMDYSYFLFYWSLIEPSKLTVPYILAYCFAGWMVLHGVKECGKTADIGNEKG